MTTNTDVNYQIKVFVEAAIEKGDFHPNSDLDVRLFKLMKQAFQVLYSSETGREKFRELITHENVHVKQWVSTQLLTEGLSMAKDVLEHMSQERVVTGGNARIVLSQHAKGELKPPFGITESFE